MFDPVTKQAPNVELQLKLLETHAGTRVGAYLRDAKRIAEHHGVSVEDSDSLMKLANLLIQTDIASYLEDISISLDAATTGGAVKAQRK